MKASSFNYMIIIIFNYIIIGLASKCPNQLPTAHMGANFTIPSSFGEIQLFPGNLCAYYLSNGFRKFNIKDSIPFFKYLEVPDYAVICRAIDPDIKNYSEYCQKQESSDRKTLHLGTLIIYLKSTDISQKSVDNIFNGPGYGDIDVSYVLGAEMEENVFYLRFKCSKSTVQLVRTKTIEDFHDTVSILKENLTFMYVYDGKVDVVFRSRLGVN